MTSEPDFNAHIPGAPRAGCTAADRGQALWDVMTVLAGRRALGSVHADETRGGMDEIEELWPLIIEAIDRHSSDYDIRYVHVVHRDDQVGRRRDVLVYDHDAVNAILQKYGLWDLPDAGNNLGVLSYGSNAASEFLDRSLTEIFPLGFPERNAIDEMYGEDSQSQWRKITEKESQ